MATKKYAKPRAKIPAEIQRIVKIEARHSCIVCKTGISLELHHIDGNRENNDPENIACICANHHTQAGNGQITRLELKEYKKRAKEEDETIRKLRQELAYYAAAPVVSVSQPFSQIQTKYQNILRDFSDKMLFYQSFIFLIPQFFLDNRGDRARAIVRELLEIKPDEEKTIISHLQSAGLIELTGDLVSLKDNTDAKIALGELIDTGRLDLDKTTKLFLNI